MLSEQLENVIGAVRERLDMSKVSDVAESCGLSQSGVYRILGGGNPSLATLKTLCRHFDNEGTE